MRPSLPVMMFLLGVLILGAGSRGDDVPRAKVFRAGASAIDVSPVTLPCIVNGGFLQNTAKAVQDRLHARGLVLDDGTTRLAIVVVDSCMMPRDLLDRAKAKAHEATGIPTDHMLISATHTHSAPSAMGALGTPPDPDYVEFLPGKIAEAIEQAARNLAPAEIGWGVVDDFDHTHCRRWIRRPDKLLNDPFGQPTVRANMHPGYVNPDVIGPSGPVDPGLSVVAVRSPEGRPIALLANYSMHYFGASPVSADYYGRFAARMAELVGEAKAESPFVAMMSQGTSGDQHWMDYSQPQKKISIDEYADAVARRAFEAYKAIDYHKWVPLAMAETTLTLRRRVPDEARLAWARPIVAAMGDRVPRQIPEVYAKEAIELHEHPERELKLQAICVGDLGIAAIPDEVYAITGLKIKGMSPLATTFTIELANGSEGYIPPPEQHALGGYTTWPARTAALEVQAEPKIVETVLTLLEKVSSRSRRSLNDPSGPYPKAVLASNPWAYWRLGDLIASKAQDASGNGRAIDFHPGIALGLDGPPSPAFSGEGVLNRAAHFAGGRLKAESPSPGTTYTVELWFWNGLPNDVRPVTGYVVSRGPDGDPDAPGDHFGIGGTHDASGRLFVYNGNTAKELLHGSTEIAPRTWHHVVFARDGERIAVYLDGKTEPEIVGALKSTVPSKSIDLFLGGRSDGYANFEGKIDEVALYDRALKPSEVAAHYRASRPEALSASTSRVKQPAIDAEKSKQAARVGE